MRKSNNLKIYDEISSKIRSLKLGLLEYDGRGVREWQSYKKELEEKLVLVVAEMLDKAEKKSPEIWHAIGDAYENGNCIEQDVTTAEVWFRKAADAGHVPSMRSLGRLLGGYSQGAEKKRESIQWYLRAAEYGDSHAMLSLGRNYLDGENVAEDKIKAANWFIQAYEAGCEYAAEYVGKALSYDPDHHFEAIKWLKIVIRDDIYFRASALHKLILIYEDRNSPAYNPKEAYECWVEIAKMPCENKRFEAMFRLSYYCQHGYGTEKNIDEAKRWLDEIINNYNDINDYRKALSKRKKLEENLFS